MEDTINIMVVDNDPETVKKAWPTLTREGHFIEGVLSGKEAIHKLQQDNYDLVFTELVMRGIDGITLIRWIRQYRPATAVVAVTSDPVKKLLKEAHELDIVSHIIKPVAPEMLREATGEALKWIAEKDARGVQEEEIPPEMLAELDRVMEQYGKMSSHVIRVLLHAQEMYGYLPAGILKRIARGLNMYPSEVRSIVSFYSCFRTKPEGRHAPHYTGGYERAWNSVAWMTGKKALHAVNEFIRGRQSASV